MAMRGTAYCKLVIIPMVKNWHNPCLKLRLKRPGKPVRLDPSSGGLLFLMAPRGINVIIVMKSTRSSVRVLIRKLLRPSSSRL